MRHLISSLMRPSNGHAFVIARVYRGPEQADRVFAITDPEAAQIPGRSLVRRSGRGSASNID